MKNLFIANCALLFSSVTCYVYAETASSDIIRYTETVEPYRAVNASMGIIVVLSDGVGEEITVTSRRVSRDDIVIEVVNGVLMLSIDEKFYKNRAAGNKEIKITVSDNVHSLVGSTGVNFTADRIDSDKPVDIVLSTGSVFKGNITAEKISVNLSTGSRIESYVETDCLEMRQKTGTISVLSGSAERVSLVSNTGSDSRWSDMEIHYLKTVLETASIAVVDADIIEAKVTTGGVLKYIGKPDLQSIEVSTGGTIKSVKL